MANFHMQDFQSHKLNSKFAYFGPLCADVDFKPDVCWTSSYVQTGATGTKLVPEFTYLDISA